MTAGTAAIPVTRFATRAPFVMTLDFPFDATHRLDRLPEPDREAHEHHFIVRLVLHAEDLDAYGFLGGCDYDAVEETFGGWLRGHVAGRHLNDTLAADPDVDRHDPQQANPSIERLAWWFYRVAHRLGLEHVTEVWVSIQRTPTTWVGYAPVPTQAVQLCRQVADGEAEAVRP